MSKELNEYYYYEDRVVTPATHLYRVYHADDVDVLLAKKEMEISNLKAELSYIKADSTFDRDKHKELLKLKDEEIRRLRRALWLARAMRAEAQWNRQLRDAGIAFAIGENKAWDFWNQKQKKWQGVERKCRAKAEEYK